MPTLDEYMALLQGDPSQMKQQRLSALLGGLGAGLLSAPGWNRGLANGGLLASQGVASVQPQANDNAMQAMKTRQFAQQMADSDTAREEAQQTKDVLRNFQMPSPLPSMAPTNANAAALPPKAGTYEKLMAQADALEQKGLVQQAMKYREMAEKYAPQYDGTETLMQDGKPVVMQRYKNRAPETLSGYQPKPDYKQVDTGGQVGFYDPLTGASGGQFGKTQTPDSIASNQTAIRGQNMTDARSRESNSIASGNNVAGMVSGLRKEYNALQPVQNYVAAAPLIESARNAPDTPAGDLDLIYAVGKALDPNSVVREGELNLIIKSGSPLQRFQGYVNSIGSGRGRLPPAQREQLLGMLKNRVGQLKAAHDQAAMPFINQAQSMNLPMDQVFQLDKAPANDAGLSPAEQQELDALRKRFGR